MLMEMNRYLSFTLFTGLSLLTTIPIEAYTLNPNKTATSILQTNVIEVRSITSVQPIVIYCPVGTVPQLPYQVWVTYSDGQGEYRQTKWSNSALSTEQSEADDKSLSHWKPIHNKRIHYRRRYYRKRISYHC